MRRWPRLHRRLATWYYASREIVERHVVGTRLQEFLWKRRASISGPAAEAAFAESLLHAHRPILLRAIAEQEPIDSVLEVGCGSGPNLHLLAQRYPAATLHGLDINLASIAEASTRFETSGVRNVRLEVGGLEELARYPDSSFDVVCADAVLMYVGPDRIQRVLREMHRVSRKALVLSEWQTPHATSASAAGSSRRAESRYVNGRWAHDYSALLPELSDAQHPTIRKYDVVVWADEHWQEFGCVIVVPVSPT